MFSFLKPMNPPITNWQGHVVWIVGGSTGIGLACAHALVERGAHVIVSARSAPPLQDFVAQYGADKASAVALDVTDAQACTAAAQAIWQQHRHVDMVLFAAGTYQALRATAFDLGVMTQHLQVNVQGAYNLLAAVLPQLIAQGQRGQRAHISLISSVAGWRGLPNSLAYGPTKAALTHVGEVLYLDLARHTVGVSVVHPGFVETPLTAQNTFHMPALISPQAAAQAMLAAWGAGEFDIHYPKRFTWWLKLIRILPFRWAQALILKATKL
jgi:NADP-dependent 3-hydroxy acid dehydrogenase YdfG